MNALAERQPPAAPAVVSETEAVLSMIERAARDPQVDIDKFERLMAMRERMESKAKEEAFNEAMSAAQAEMPQVVRDATNDHTKSSYATMEAISKAIAPIYTRHGFSLSFGTDASPLPNHHRIVCTAARGGYSRQFFADLPPDLAGSQGRANKTPIQAFGSTMSYGRRYLTMLIFNIAVKDDDDGNGQKSDEAISEEQLKSLQAMIDETHSDIRLFCKFFGVAALADLPAARYGEASAKLQQKARKAS